MLLLTIRNIVANKARVALITLAVIIGVSFVSSTFVFSDSLSKTFEGLATDIAAGVDLEVRPVDQFGSSDSLTTATVDELRDVEGVRAVGAHREAENIVPVLPTGELSGGFGFGFAWLDDSELGGFDLAKGTAPAVGEFAMSSIAAEREGFVLGESYQISTPTGLATRTLSGLVDFRGDDAIEANLTFTLFPLGDAQQLFGGSPEQVDAVMIALDDPATSREVQADIGASIGDQLEIVNQRTVEEEQAAEFNSQVSLLRNVLLGFAFVSLFVSTYIIYNTFGIILNQRVREIGLLRAIGAGAGHVGRSVMAEAFFIGLIASVGGLAAGLGLNAGLIALFDLMGASLPDMETIVATRTIVFAFAIGIGVTMISAIGPARQAGRVAPVTAMNGLSARDARNGRRVIVGTGVAFAGALLALFGMFTATGTEAVLASVGLGIAAIFIGITLLSPALARPIVAAVGAPLARLGGVSGLLARENAARNPRRTANTAAALMVGLSLITTVLVVGQSVKAHISSTLSDTVSADFVVSNEWMPMGADVADSMDTITELGAVLPVSEIEVMAANEVRPAEAVRFSALGRLFDVDVTQGSIPTGGTASAMLSEPVAEDLDIGIGETIEIVFDNNASAEFVVEGLFTDTTLLNAGLMLERAAVGETYALRSVEWVAASAADGVDVSAAAAALAVVAEDYPQVDVQTRTEYRESVESEIDQLLSIVNIMLALSIVIALIGIGLTLALSVFERTREIGLLRAVGMSTRQVRRMIRWEAALIAVFGAVLGVATGLLYGWGTVTALPDTITSGLSVPSQRLVLLVIASAIAGLTAAMLPARRAGRMNVLDAVNGR